jgi:hypothetical protein
MAPDCALQKAPPGPVLVANVAIPFIDRSSEMWNFRL